MDDNFVQSTKNREGNHFEWRMGMKFQIGRKRRGMLSKLF